MKIPLLTILILASLAGMAQTKTTWQNKTVRLSETYAVSGNSSIGTVLPISSYAQQPQSVWIYSGTQLMTRIEPSPNMSKIDSLVIHVRKSQLRWINDSTAVIHKSN